MVELPVHKRRRACCIEKLFEGPLSELMDSHFVPIAHEPSNPSDSLLLGHCCLWHQDGVMSAMRVATVFGA